ALKGKPAAVLLWSSQVAAARSAFDTLRRGATAFRQGGVGVAAIAVDDPRNRETSLSYAILNRHLFMNRQDLRLPTCLLLAATASVAKFYRDRLAVGQIGEDAGAIGASPEERLARALPFQGSFYAGLPQRSCLPYGRELRDQGLQAVGVIAFDRAAQANPGAS